MDREAGIVRGSLFAMKYGCSKKRARTDDSEGVVDEDAEVDAQEEAAKKVVRGCQGLYETFVKGVYTNILRFRPPAEDGGWAPGTQLMLTEEGTRLLGDSLKLFPPLARSVLYP